MSPHDASSNDAAATGLSSCPNRNPKPSQLQKRLRRPMARDARRAAPKGRSALAANIGSRGDCLRAARRSGDRLDLHGTVRNPARARAFGRGAHRARRRRLRTGPIARSARAEQRRTAAAGIRHAAVRARRRQNFRRRQRHRSRASSHRIPGRLTLSDRSPFLRLACPVAKSRVCCCWARAWSKATKSATASTCSTKRWPWSRKPAARSTRPFIDCWPRRFLSFRPRNSNRRSRMWSRRSPKKAFRPTSASPRSS